MMQAEMEAGPEARPLALNSRRTLEALRVGHERNCVLVIDDVFENPELLIAFAETAPEFSAVAGDFYPGLRKPLPDIYAASILDAVAAPIADHFEVPQARAPRSHFCALSLATRAPATLHPLQRIPHFDTTSSDQLAAVVYLCDRSHGGTAFYRHRSTGFETVTEARAGRYRQALESEARTGGIPAPAYIEGDTPLFERVAAVEARFNRAVVYRSNMLHSGDIRPKRGLSAVPRLGRLTANIFVSLPAVI